MIEFFMDNYTVVLHSGDVRTVNNLTVILMGLGVVFAGLIGLVLVCSVTGAICKSLIKEKTPAPAPVSAGTAVASSTDEIPDRGSFIAAVSAAIAEASGTDAAGIRIVKIEKK